MVDYRELLKKYLFLLQDRGAYTYLELDDSKPRHITTEEWVELRKIQEEAEPR